MPHPELKRQTEMGRKNRRMRVKYAFLEFRHMKDKDHNNGNDAEKHAAAVPEHGHAEAGHVKDHMPHTHAHTHPPAEHSHSHEKAPPQAETEKLKAAHAELAAVKDRLLRLQADFDNVRKRAIKERSEIYARANEDIMLEILPVLDHLDLALATAAEHEITGAQAAVVDGFRLVSEQLMSVLKKFGLEPINAEGQPFDANRHEAIAQMPSETVAEGSVITQTRRGWMLGDKLLRPAQVVLSAGSAGRATAAEEGETAPVPEDGQTAGE
jgi:molecular chaperone GrpE